ncbi:MAG: hypothetical protein H6506_05100 [Calditrichaeota bacterium]|nr:hypothetical protein [Calditrichota bacterium]MCB9392013.1 hypothetical protein [Calditrichota bacterium]
MSFIKSVLRKVGLGTLTRAAGFTLFEQTIVIMIGSTALLGGWAAYRDFSMQWRVSMAERQMDQYAQAAMSEMINVLQWSMGSQQLAGGRNPLWRIAIGEYVNENGGFNAGQDLGSGHFPYIHDGYFSSTTSLYDPPMTGGFITLSHRSNQGILLNGRQPEWANSRSGMYVWRGDNRSGPNELAAMDRRDEMSVKSFSIDFPLYQDPATNVFTDEISRKKFGESVMKITLVMQYRYRAEDVIGLYGDDYIRERVYETSVASLNFGESIVNNRYFQEFIQGRLIAH